MSFFYSLIILTIIRVFYTQIILTFYMGILCIPPHLQARRTQFGRKIESTRKRRKNRNGQFYARLRSCRPWDSFFSHSIELRFSERLQKKDKKSKLFESLFSFRQLFLFRSTQNACVCSESCRNRSLG